MRLELTIIFAAVLLCIPTLSVADASWYGSIRTYLSYRDEPNQQGIADQYWDIRDYYSRFGVRGNNMLGNGLVADYVLEFALLSDRAQLRKQARLSYIGLRGRLGALHIGQQWSPLYNTAFANIDVFNSLDPVFYQGDFRLSNMLQYAAPLSSNNLAQIALIVDGESEEQNNIDATILGLKGQWKQLTGAVGYNRTVDDNLFTREVTFGYDFGKNSQIWINHEDSNRIGSAGRVYRILGALGLGNHILRAVYSKADEIDDKAIQLGWQYDLSGNSRVAIEWQSLSRKTDTDTSLLNFALRTDF